MFTGLVEGLATVAAIVPESVGIRLEIHFPGTVTGELSLGESVALNGCCLTVVEKSDLTAAFQAGTETLSKTSLGKLVAGDRVNFERSLAANARLGGHFVQGHVDGVGTVSEITREGDWTTMWFRVPTELARMMVPKGSIAIDGVSLTLVNVTPDTCSIALIPHTLSVTTLGFRQVGDPVNLETDILGKYVLKMLDQLALRPQ